MPRYFFNIHDGSSLIDTEGTVLPDLAAARAEAVRTSGVVITVLNDTFWELQHNAEWTLEVLDDHRRPVLRLRFSAERLN